MASSKIRCTVNLAACLAVAVTVTLPIWAGRGDAQGSAPSPTPRGPVQGYHGGYDPTDKSQAPAATGGREMDTGNPDEGRRARDVSGHIKAIEGRKLTLDSGIVLVLPPTLTVDRGVLAVGARVHARYEDRDGTYVVTAIGREPS
jgi:hypothetical protein